MDSVSSMRSITNYHNKTPLLAKTGFSSHLLASNPLTSEVTYFESLSEVAAGFKQVAVSASSRVISDWTRVASGAYSELATNLSLKRVRAISE